MKPYSYVRKLLKKIILFFNFVNKIAQSIFLPIIVPQTVGAREVFFHISKCEKTELKTDVNKKSVSKTLH